MLVEIDNEEFEEPDLPPELIVDTEEFSQGTTKGDIYALIQWNQRWNKALHNGNMKIIKSLNIHCNEIKGMKKDIAENTKHRESHDVLKRHRKKLRDLAIKIISITFGGTGVGYVLYDLLF